MIASVQPTFYIRHGCIASADSIVQAIRYSSDTCETIHAWLGLPHSPSECDYAFTTGIGCELAVPDNELRVRPGDIVARNAATGRYGVYREDNFEFLYGAAPGFTFEKPPLAQRHLAYA